MASCLMMNADYIKDSIILHAKIEGLENASIKEFTFLEFSLYTLAGRNFAAEILKKS